MKKRKESEGREKWKNGDSKREEAMVKERGETMKGGGEGERRWEKGREGV